MNLPFRSLATLLIDSDIGSTLGSDIPEVLVGNRLIPHATAGHLLKIVVQSIVHRCRGNHIVKPLIAAFASRGSLERKRHLERAEFVAVGDYLNIEISTLGLVSTDGNGGVQDGKIGTCHLHARVQLVDLLLAEFFADDVGMSCLCGSHRVLCHCVALLLKIISHSLSWCLYVYYSIKST